MRRWLDLRVGVLVSSALAGYPIASIIVSTCAGTALISSRLADV